MGRPFPRPRGAVVPLKDRGEQLGLFGEPIPSRSRDKQVSHERDADGHLVALAKRATAEDDAITRARLLLRLEELVSAELTRAVRQAHANGATWRQIADSLGVPRQTVFRRHRTRSTEGK